MDSPSLPLSELDQEIGFWNSVYLCGGLGPTVLGQYMDIAGEESRGEEREETVFHTNRVVLMPLLLCRHIQLCVTSSTDCFHETFF